MFDLKTYLRNVYELEASIYQQTHCVESINNRISRLPQKPDEHRIKHQSKSSSKTGTVLSILGAVAGISGIILAKGGNFNTGVDEGIFALGALLLFGLAGFLLYCGIPMLLGGVIGSAKDQKTFSNMMATYENGLVVKKALDADLLTMRAKLSDTQSLLRSYYAKGILHPKYQNFVAVSYLLDCIETGRYTKLEGPDGAYNQFELEIRMDRISSQLDAVIDKLDQIRQNQYSLYAAITEANRSNERIIQRLDGYCRNLENLNSTSEQIRRSLDTANHTAELTRKEIAYRNYLDHGSSYSN